MQSAEYDKMDNESKDWLDTLFNRTTKTLKELNEEFSLDTKLEMLRLRKEKFKPILK